MFKITSSAPTVSVHGTPLAQGRKRGWCGGGGCYYWHSFPLSHQIHNDGSLIQPQEYLPNQFTFLPIALLITNILQELW